VRIPLHRWQRPRPRPRALILIENLPLQRDARVKRQCATLLGAGWDVTVVCPRSDEALDESLRNVRLRTWRAPSEGSTRFHFLVEYATALAASAWIVAREAAGTGFDVIQSCNPPDFLFLVAAPFRLVGIPFVFDHHDLTPELFAARFGTDTGVLASALRGLERATFATASHVIATNESVKAVALERGHRSPSDVTVVRNGPVLADVVRREPTPSLRNGRAHLVCWHGVMGSADDGLGLALEMIAHLVHGTPQRKDCHFVFLGDGEERPHLERLAAELAIEDHIAFPGWVSMDVIHDHLATASVGIVPDPKTAGVDKATVMKVMEYMAFEVPIVAFDVDETRVSAAEAALYAADNDPASMAELVAALLDDPQTRRAMGRCGRNRIENGLAWDHQERRYLEVFQGMCPHGAGRGVDVSAVRRSNEPELLSFDLYDTVVVRNVGPERAIHHLVAHAARSDPAIDFRMPDDDYASARRDADRSAWRTSAAPSLDQIHDQLVLALQLDPDCSERLRELELHFELRSLVAVPGRPKRLAELRTFGSRIAFTTDTHIGSRHLAPRLREIGILGDEDVLIVSSDHGLSKSSGGHLFRELVARTELEPAAIRHHGDHSSNDVTMARRQGLEGRLDRTAAFNRYESMMADGADPTGLAALLAGASRIVRLRARQRGESSGLTDVICGVAAPTMIGFALWIAGRVETEQLSRVSFLSRNGRIPFEVFRRLGPAIGSDVPHDYLRISRDAVRLPSAGAVGVERWLDVGNATDGAFLTEFGERLSVDRLIEKLGLDPQTDAPMFARHGLVTDLPLLEQDLHSWHAALDDERILDRLRSSSELALERLRRYLVQEGIDDCHRLGMVDVGWSGQQAAMISSAVAHAFGPQSDIRHLHLGAVDQAPRLAPTSIETFLFDAGDTPVNNPVGLYELFSATSEPGMAGLREMPDGRIEPLFRPPGPAERTAVADPLRRLVVEVAEELVGHIRPAHRDADLRPLLKGLAARFWFEPTHEEADAWGSLPWEVDSSGLIVRPFAEPITASELPFVLRPGGLQGRQWSPGAVARSPLPVRWLLDGPVRRRTQRLVN
jgi:glycosyltransferase involved in cell wall biosynthesis/FMN phosphatase YigB (HAD superfamily)